jgi:hypothetical protein
VETQDKLRVYDKRLGALTGSIPRAVIVICAQRMS